MAACASTSRDFAAATGNGKAGGGTRPSSFYLIQARARRPHSCLRSLEPFPWALSSDRGVWRCRLGGCDVRRVGPRQAERGGFDLIQHWLSGRMSKRSGQSRTSRTTTMTMSRRTRRMGAGARTSCWPTRCSYWYHQRFGV